MLTIIRYALMNSKRKKKYAYLSIIYFRRPSEIMKRKDILDISKGITLIFESFTH